jgi:hypothetical protein
MALGTLLGPFVARLGWHSQGYARQEKAKKPNQKPNQE